MTLKKETHNEKYYRIKIILGSTRESKGLKHLLKKLWWQWRIW